MKDRYFFKAKNAITNEWVTWSILSGLYGLNFDPSTICQCTGLKDKNGKLIWENDIIKAQAGIAKVVWDKSAWRIEWIKSTIWRKDLFYWAVEDIQRVEVIGNIFDNPELLESEG